MILSNKNTLTPGKLCYFPLQNACWVSKQRLFAVCSGTSITSDVWQPICCKFWSQVCQLHKTCVPIFLPEQQMFDDPLSGTTRVSLYQKAVGRNMQGWARDVSGRDRDETETFGLTSRDETETRRSNFEARPRRDVCRSRDVTETLKCTFIVINAAYYLNKLTM